MATEAANWTIVYRKPRANHFTRTADWSGSWAEAADYAQEFATAHAAENLQVFYTVTRDADEASRASHAARYGEDHPDFGNILTDSGKRVRILDKVSDPRLTPFAASQASPGAPQYAYTFALWAEGDDHRCGVVPGTSIAYIATSARAARAMAVRDYAPERVSHLRTVEAIPSDAPRVTFTVPVQLPTVRTAKPSTIRETSMSNDSGAIVITGAAKIDGARLLTVRMALKLEILTGMKRSSRGTSTRQLANDITGGSHKTNRAAYEALDAYIVANLGMPSHPLPPKR
jgi:hypothetical protein